MQVRGVRCRKWGKKFPGKWDYSAGTDLVSEHLVPATFLRHRQQNPSRSLDSAHHVISQPQVLHCILFRSKPTSSRNCIEKAWSQNRCVRNILFGPTSSRSIARHNDDLGMNSIHCRCSSYSLTTWHVLHRCFVETRRTLLDTLITARRMAVWPVQEVCCTVRGT